MLKSYKIDNNFMIPKIWRILRENHIEAQIVFPVQMDSMAEKWQFDFAPKEIENVKNKILPETAQKYIQPLDYRAEYPYGTKIEFRHYSMKKCLDWLIENLNDDQWFFDDFRGEKSFLMESKYTHEVYAPCYWALKTVDIFFAKQEDMNLFKVLKENFKNAN